MHSHTDLGEIAKDYKLLQVLSLLVTKLLIQELVVHRGAISYEDRFILSHRRRV